MKDYKNKFEYLYFKQKGICPVCKKIIQWNNADLHHKLRNHKGNRKKYKYFLDSIYNLEIICHDCHINHHGSCGKITEKEAREIEERLQKEKCSKE